MARKPQPQHRHYRTRIVASNGGALSHTPPLGEMGFQFLNGLHRTVTVATRTGLRIEVPFQRINGSRPAFVIRMKVHAGPGVNLDAVGLCNDQGATTSAEADALLQAIVLEEGRFTGRVGRQIVVDYHIPESDFDAQGGTLFMQNLDLLVSTLTPTRVPHHPYSLAGSRDRISYDAQSERTLAGTTYSVFVRDKDGVFGPRFMNLNGSIFRIPVIRDESQDRDGVYCIVGGRTLGDFDVDRTLVEYFSFDEADKALNLYRTFNEAETLGNPQDVFKRELEERVQRLKLEELDIREARLAADREHEAQKEQYRRFNAEREQLLYQQELVLKQMDRDYAEREARLRRDTLLLKEIAEGRGHDRREALEMLKVIPAIITGVVGVVVAVKKLNA